MLKNNNKRKTIRKMCFGGNDRALYTQRYPCRKDQVQIVEIIFSK